MKSYNEFIADKGNAYKDLSAAQKRRRYEDYKENFLHAAGNHTEKVDDRFIRTTGNKLEGEMADQVIHEEVAQECAEHLAASQVVMGTDHSGKPISPLDTHIPGSNGFVIKVPFKWTFALKSQINGTRNRVAIAFQPDLHRFYQLGDIDVNGQINFSNAWQEMPNYQQFIGLYDTFTFGNVHIEIVPTSNWTETSGTITKFNLPLSEDLGANAFSDSDLKNRAFSVTKRGTQKVTTDAIPLSTQAWDFRKVNVMKPNGQQLGTKQQSSLTPVDISNLVGFQVQIMSDFNDAEFDNYQDVSRVAGWTMPGFYIDSTANEVLDFEITATALLGFTPKLNLYGNPTVKQPDHNFSRSSKKGVLNKVQKHLADSNPKASAAKAKKTVGAIIDGAGEVADVLMGIGTLLL